MKSFLRFLSIAFMALFVFASCTKEGPAGADGADGEDGIDGTDGTAGCVQCHEGNEDMMVKSYEWAESGHVNNGHMMGYYASRTGCADCHSSQGFQHVVETGEWGALTPEKPLPANCYTCHKIHETYTAADWGFRKTDAVTLIAANDYASDQGTANTCVQCHQSRTTDPIDFDATEYTITSQRFGPHHGPQGNMMAGVGNTGAYELEGSSSYADSQHATSLNCVDCHMASGAGSSGNFGLGGHSFNVGSGSWEDDSRTINVNGCTDCHNNLADNSDATTFVKNAVDENMLLIEELHNKLMSLGYVNASGYVINNGSNAGSSNPLIVSPTHAAAIFNYKFLSEDQSSLIHNPKYAKALLRNSLEALN